jgi:hypothetical protein
MTILGNSGCLRLRRESGTTITLTNSQRINDGSGFNVVSPGLLSGDPVTVAIDAPAFLPLTGYDTTRTANLFAHVTPFGALYLYTTVANAINGALTGPNAPIAVSNTAFSITLTPTATGWEYPAYLTGFELRTSAPALETTGLGEDFYDGIRGVISGSGRLPEFFIHRTRRTRPGLDGVIVDQLMFHYLTLATGRGAKAEAQFWLSAGNNLMPGDLYYSATIMFTESVLDNSADDVVLGSADFIVLGPVNLMVNAELVNPQPDYYTC